MINRRPGRPQARQQPAEPEHHALLVLLHQPHAGRQQHQRDEHYGDDDNRESHDLSLAFPKIVIGAGNRLSLGCRADDPILTGGTPRR